MADDSKTKKVRAFMEVEIIGGVFMMFIFDGIAIMIDLTGVGLAIAPFLQAAATAISNGWMAMKGNKGAMKIGNQVAKYAANFLPVVPTNTIVFAYGVWSTNREARRTEKMRFVAVIQEEEEEFVPSEYEMGTA